MPISGLAAAYYLNQRGVRPILIEKQPRLGGLIETRHLAGCTLEAGPESFLSTKPWAVDLVRAAHRRYQDLYPRLGSWFER